MSSKPETCRRPAGAALAAILMFVLQWDGAASAAAVPPRRVVSLNLCADQLLLALADRDQILSLSPLVRDASISYLRANGAGLPVNAGKAEAVLFSGADL